MIFLSLTSFSNLGSHLVSQELVLHSSYLQSFTYHNTTSSLKGMTASRHHKLSTIRYLIIVGLTRQCHTIYAQLHIIT